MDAGTLGRVWSCLVIAALLTALWIDLQPAQAADNQAEAEVSIPIEIEGALASASPGDSDKPNLEGLLAYRSVLLTPENLLDPKSNPQIRKIVDTRRFPEPSTLIIMGLGLLGLAGIGRKIRKR